MKKTVLLCAILTGLLWGGGRPCAQASRPAAIPEDTLLRRARQAQEAWVRSERFVQGWLAHRDPLSGLIPRNLNGDDYWNAQDAAADNYPFMVLTSFFTDRKRFEGTMHEILERETALTSRLGACPATYDFRKQGFREEPADTGNVIFGSAEYMKDGLLPLTEWLGPSPWSGRMLSILDDLHELVEVVTELEGDYLGGSQVVEVNGDLLQVLSRVYWMTGERKYLDWALRIGDHYLLDGRNPGDFSRLRLRDHGGEIVLGLCELYATARYARPEKYAAYRPGIYHMLDRILATRNADGLFYDEINPQAGSVLTSHLADTWGYILDGYYTVYMLDGHRPYREAVRKALGCLDERYRDHDWEGNHDGYADAVESALNLYNREPVASAAAWIDSETARMFAMQRPDGVIGGWHGDGNFARTAIMYALWKTGGSYVTRWHDGVVWGAEVSPGRNAIRVLVHADKKWKGALRFDRPRHRTALGLPIDWTRINQFPEWFCADADAVYSVSVDGARPRRYKGSQLHEGVRLALEAGEQRIIEVTKNER